MPHGVILTTLVMRDKKYIGGTIRCIDTNGDCVKRIEFSGVVGLDTAIDSANKAGYPVSAADRESNLNYLK